MASLLGQFVRNTVVAVTLIVAALHAVPSGAAPYAAHVMDARTGETLYEKNANTRLHPASLTKMMTLYVAFEEIEKGRIGLDSMVTISKHAAAQPPSRLGLRAGQKIALRHLIRAAAVKSANDAATAIGEAIGGSEAKFAARMNRTAKAIGMTASTFRNMNGLTASGHLSTARDMSVLGRRLFYDFPQYYNIFSRRSTDAGMAEVNNTNRRFLDAYKGADGIKTGFTNAAGFNLTASAERGSVRIIATVLGGQSTAQRNAKMAELLDLGFRTAPRNAGVQVPAEPVYSAEPALVADAGTGTGAGNDVIDEVGGAGKTIRLVMTVRKSPRPRLRPNVILDPEIALAMQEGIMGALAEANGTPPPPDTLEAQSVVLAEVPAQDAGPHLPETMLAAIADPDPAGVAAAGTLAAQSQALAANGTVAAAPRQAAETPEATEAALAAVAQEAGPSAGKALPLAKPRVRPQAPAAETTVAADALPAAAAPAPAPENTLQAQAAELPQAALERQAALPPSGTLDGQAAALLPPPALPDSTAPATAAPAGVQELAAVAPFEIASAAVTLPLRRAPIFAKVPPVAEDLPQEQEVVARMSTSGGRHWGVNVGSFNSRAEAERVLLKTQLSESATLNVGLRKVAKSKRGFDANFLGLSEDQAGLACRRLQARAVKCVTLGP